MQRANGGFTCPAVRTRNPAGKGFSPGPHRGGRGAPPGQVLRGLARLIGTPKQTPTPLFFSTRGSSPISNPTLVCVLANPEQF